jgi:hypothetical protein
MGRDQEYADWIDSARKTLAGQKDEVEALMEGLAGSLPEVFREVLLLLGQAEKQDPNKSHFIVAELVHTVKDYQRNENKIKRYLAMKEKVRNYDERVAALEEEGV